MTTTLKFRVKAYSAALKEWLNRDGLNGGGGPWIKEKKVHTRQPEPVPECDGDFEKRIFANIKDSAVKEQLARVKI